MPLPLFSSPAGGRSLKTERKLKGAALPGRVFYDETRHMHLIAALLFLLAPQQQRIEALEARLVAPCCWSESVKDHQSPVAVAMRAEIARFVAEGKSDAEILDYYKQQYGARVLIEPEGNTLALAILVPVVMALIGAGFVVHRIRRLRAA